MEMACEIYQIRILRKQVEKTLVSPIVAAVHRIFGTIMRRDKNRPVAAFFFCKFNFDFEVRQNFSVAVGHFFAIGRYADKVKAVYRIVSKRRRTDLFVKSRLQFSDVLNP